MFTTYNIYLKLKLTKLKIFLQEISIHLKTKYYYIKQVYTQFDGKKCCYFFFVFVFSTDPEPVKALNPS